MSAGVEMFCLAVDDGIRQRTSQAVVCKAVETHDWFSWRQLSGAIRRGKTSDGSIAFLNGDNF